MQEIKYFILNFVIFINLWNLSRTEDADRYNSDGTFSNYVIPHKVINSNTLTKTDSTFILNQDSNFNTFLNGSTRQNNQRLLLTSETAETQKKDLKVTQNVILSSNEQPVINKHCLARGIEIDMDKTKVFDIAYVTSLRGCTSRCRKEQCIVYSYNYRTKNCVMITVSTLGDTVFKQSPWGVSTERNCSSTGSSAFCIKPSRSIDKVRILRTQENYSLWQCHTLLVSDTTKNTVYNFETQTCHLTEHDESALSYKGFFATIYGDCSKFQVGCTPEITENLSYDLFVHDEGFELKKTNARLYDKIPIYSVLNYSCKDENKILIPHEAQLCSIDGTLEQMIPVCENRSKRITVLADENLVDKTFIDKFVEPLSELIPVTSIKSYPLSGKLRISEYLQESTGLILPFVDETNNFAKYLETDYGTQNIIKDFVVNGGNLFLFGDNRIPAILFGWSFKTGGLCIPSQQDSSKYVLPTIPGEYLTGILASSIKSSHIPVSISKCENDNTLSPIITVDHGAGKIVVLKTDFKYLADPSDTFLKKSFGNTFLHLNSLLEKSPIYVQGISTTQIDKCLIYGGLFVSENTCCKHRKCSPSTASCDNISLPCYIQPYVSKIRPRCPKLTSSFFKDIELRNKEQTKINCEDDSYVMGISSTGDLLSSLIVTCNESSKIEFTPIFANGEDKKIEINFSDIVCVQKNLKPHILGESNKSENFFEVLKQLNKIDLETPILKDEFKANIIIIPPKYYNWNISEKLRLILNSFIEEGGLLLDLAGVLTINEATHTDVCKNSEILHIKFDNNIRKDLSAHKDEYTRYITNKFFDQKTASGSLLPESINLTKIKGIIFQTDKLLSFSTCMGSQKLQLIGGIKKYKGLLYYDLLFPQFMHTWYNNKKNINEIPYGYSSLINRIILVANIFTPDFVITRNYTTDSLILKPSVSLKQNAGFPSSFNSRLLFFVTVIGLTTVFLVIFCLIIYSLIKKKSRSDSYDIGNKQATYDAKFDRVGRSPNLSSRIQLDSTKLRRISDVFSRQQKNSDVGTAPLIGSNKTSSQGTSIDKTDSSQLKSFKPLSHGDSIRSIKNYDEVKNIPYPTDSTSRPVSIHKVTESRNSPIGNSINSFSISSTSLPVFNPINQNLGDWKLSVQDPNNLR